MNVAELKRLYMTYASSVAITTQLYARSKNGVVSKTYDLPLTTARMQTEKLQAQAQWGESAYVYINEVLTTLFRLHMIGIQFEPSGEI